MRKILCITGAKETPGIGGDRTLLTVLGEFDYGPTTGRFAVEVANKTLPSYIEGQRNIIHAGDVGLGLVRVCEAGKPAGHYLRRLAL